MDKILIGVAMFICGLASAVLYSKSQQPPPFAMSYGFYEEKQVWNRIRVDSNGHVVCAE